MPLHFASIAARQLVEMIVLICTMSFVFRQPCHMEDFLSQVPWPEHDSCAAVNECNI